MKARFGNANADYQDTERKNFQSTGYDLNLGSLSNHAALTNRSFAVGQAISGAGHPYFGFRDVLTTIALRNHYNSNGGIGTGGSSYRTRDHLDTSNYRISEEIEGTRSPEGDEGEQRLRSRWAVADALVGRGGVR
jgi:hypothetical protein